MTSPHTASASFERIVTFEPAFDRRDPDPSKNYGIHGVTLRMVLKGPLGATQFLLYTNWQLPHVSKETDARILQKARKGAYPGRRLKSIRFPAEMIGEAADLIESLETAERHMSEGPPGLDDIDLRCAYHPMPADLGYHWRTPQYDGHIHRECEFVDGGECYYDGSALNAKKIHEVLLREGSEGVWRELEVYYNEIAADSPASSPGEAP